MSENRTLLSTVDLQTALQDLTHWTLSEDGTHLATSLVFDDFSTAWGAMSRIALVAEKMDHHPDWSNVYNRLVIHLSTHDAGGVTALDLELARAIDKITLR